MCARSETIFTKIDFQTKGPPLTADGGPSFVEYGLELQAERELNVALATGLSAGHLAELGVANVVVRCAELRRIRKIEALGSELDLQRSVNGKSLKSDKSRLRVGGAVIGLQTKVALR